MKFYHKAIIRSIIFVVCIIAVGGLFANEAAAQVVWDDFDGNEGGWDTPSSWSNGTTTGNKGRTGEGTSIDRSDPSTQRDVAPSISLSGKNLIFWYQSAFDIEVSCGGAGLLTTVTAAPSAWTNSGSIDVSLCTTYLRFEAVSPSGGDKGYVDDVQIGDLLTVVVDNTMIAEGEGTTARVTVPTAPTIGTLTVTLTSNSEVSLSTTTVEILVGETTSGDFTIYGVNDGIPDGTQTGTITASATGYTDGEGAVTVTDFVCSQPATIAPSSFTVDMDSHSYPTFVLVASYDWLHNFYDRNAQRGTNGASDNFNKIIALDSNLFPIITATYGDVEFPNITGRNALSWRGSGYSPSTNDYFNRSIAVGSDFTREKSVSYANLSATCSDSYTPMYRDIVQYGGRSFMQWAFITDPGNNNIRRYEFQKLGGYYAGFDAMYADELGAAEGEDATSVCSNVVQSWVTSDTYDALGGDPTKCNQKPWQVIPETFATNCSPTSYCDPDPTADGEGCYENEKVLWTCKHGDAPADDGGAGETLTGDYRNDDTSAGKVDTGIESASDLADYIAQGNYYDYMEPDIQNIPDYESGDYTFPIEICGNSRDQASDIFGIGINAKNGDTRPSNHITTTYGTFAPAGDFYVLDSWEKMVNATAYRDCQTYSITVNSSYDLDPATEGLQFRIRFYAMKQGGFVIDKLIVGDRDSAFAVKEEPGVPHGNRWLNISSFMETIPPESFPGYPSFSSAATRRSIGYGYTTNTSFGTADFVRFHDPRAIDVYRDVFDTATSVEPDNAGPLYIFVADTMNSRIQVFMNATASAGKTGADFPIRPVRVKGPQTNADFNTNEIAVRPSATMYGDGRKADWRQYTTVIGNAFVNISAGKGEFFYPHGVAVDQDPDTKDVYLFVADTYNHRIQVFRDFSGVTGHPITDKRFDFQFEKGWGTYPLQTTQTVTPPGPYHFRYPKGLDVARFANNSSYLYVVDSKNYRVLKYLISENGNGINDPQAVAGYGYNGSTFVSNLLTTQGNPLTASSSFEADGMDAVGFVNPQDVTTGYSGFYTYQIYTSSQGKAPSRVTSGYEHEITVNGEARGVKFLNNNMLYVTDYARNDASIGRDELNMRVMQFIDNFRNITGQFLPWKTEPVVFDKGELGQSVFGLYSGVYLSSGTTGSTGSTGNVPGNPTFFTDRPAGIATLTWDTISPYDLRVMNVSTSTVYSSDAAINIEAGTQLRVGLRGRGFFGLPSSNINTYINYSSTENFNLDGKSVKRIHIFCYDSTGAYRGHAVDDEVPYEFTPATDASCPTAGGYMKVIAEDSLFEWSGKTGGMIFQLQ